METDNMTAEEAIAFGEFIWEYQKAKEKHPEFPAELTEADGIIAEEHLELQRAINDHDPAEHIAEEALHVMVTAFRTAAAAITIAAVRETETGGK